MNDEEAVQIVHERTERYLEVMRAFTNGAEIQVRYKDPVGDEPIGWRDASCPVWSWFECQYRIKPIEPREFLLYPVSTPLKWGVDENVNAKGWGGAIKVREIIE